MVSAIKTKKIASHPAWEGYIVWTNKERYMQQTLLVGKPVLRINYGFISLTKHFHNGSDKVIKMKSLPSGV